MATGRAAGADNESPPSIPRVLHVAGADVYARFGRMFRQLGLALSDEGVRVALLTDDAGAATELDGTPVEDYLFQPLSRWSAWRLRGFLGRQFAQLPDVVHLWGTRCLGCVRGWAQQVGTALVIHVISLQDVRHLKRGSVGDNERLVAACEEYGRRLRDHWPARADHIRVLRPALLAPESSPGLSIRGQTLGLVWAGRMDKDSGLGVLIEAIRRLRAAHCDLQVALIGRGPAVRQVWHDVRRQRVQDCVSLITESRLWDEALVGAHIFVVPACQYELSLAPLLAMALGKAVVASRDQVADWFVEGETSLQFAPGSAAELAHQVTRVASGYPDVLAMARGAAEYVHRKHAITYLATELAGLYRALQEERGTLGPAKLGRSRE